MNLTEFFVYVDGFIIALFALLLFLLLTQIAPRTYKFYKLKHSEVTDSDDVNGFGYFTDVSFWKWLFSKQGRIELYQDAQEQKVVYYNNFRIFNFFWKITFVVLCFRVLVILFGPDVS